MWSFQLNYDWEYRFKQYYRRFREHPIGTINQIVKFQKSYYFWKITVCNSLATKKLYMTSSGQLVSNGCYIDPLIFFLEN